MRLALAFLLAVAGVAGVARAKTCTQSITVDAHGLGPVERNAKGELRSAVSDALANAIASATGAYVKQKTTLTDVVNTAMQDGAATSASKTSIEQTIEQRLSGTVLAFRITGSTVDAHKLEHVSVRATICTDKRVVLALQGDPTSVRALSGLVGDATSKLGWALVADTKTIAPSDPGAITDEALSTGASVVATGTLQLNGSESTGRTSAAAGTLNVTLTDARNLDVVDTVSVTRNGVGLTPGEARDAVLKKLSAELTRSLTARFLSPARRHVAIFKVHDVRRRNDRYTLQDALGRISGVLRVSKSTYEAASSVVLLEAETSTNTCDIARQLADTQRRILLQVDSCGEREADLKVQME